jgi:hypothetical protein
MDCDRPGEWCASPAVSSAGAAANQQLLGIVGRDRSMDNLERPVALLLLPDYYPPVPAKVATQLDCLRNVLPLNSECTSFIY